MHPLFQEWKDAVNILSLVEIDLENAIRAQFAVEKMAFFEVFGKDTTRRGAELYDDRHINYYDIDDDGCLEAWIYGSYGGENYMKWERSLIDKTGDELYYHFISVFTTLKEHEENEARKSKDAKRAQLIAELAELDKV